MKCGTASSILFLFLALILLPYTLQAQEYEATVSKRKKVLCTVSNGSGIPVLRTKTGLQTYAERKKAMAKKLKKLRGANYVRAKRQLDAFSSDMKAALKACRKALPPGTQPPGTPNNELLTPYDGPVTKEIVRLFLERAGYGLSYKEQTIVDLAISQGLAAAIDEYVRVKPEPDGLMARLGDRFDNQLGNLSTQTKDHLITNTYGYRLADLDFAINTNNPYRSNLQHFFLGLWTVGSNVLSSSQMPLWWDYWQNILYKSALDPKVPDRLVEVTRHPFMLIYLDNNLNLPGNVNENYARELLELFSMGPTRIDRTTNQVAENYVEFRNDGNRTLGDIYRIARCLTGWRVALLPDGQGIQRWRSVYSSQDHEACDAPLFEGNPWAFSISGDENIVRGIFANHPAPKDYLAREILKWFLTPEPPLGLIRALGDQIHNNGYNLEEPLKVLFRSKAFYDPAYVNTLPKNPHQLVTEFARTSSLYRTDLVPANQEGGVNVSALVGSISQSGNISRMGYDVSRPPDVFFYPTKLWTTPDTLLDVANTLFYIMGDSTTMLRAGWNSNKVLPAGDVTEGQLIDFVAEKFGCSLSEDMRTQLAFYLDSYYNGTTYTRVKYDNLSEDHQEDKGRSIVSIMGMLPCFLNK